MLRFLLLASAIFLMTYSSFAQAQSPTQCQQVREAVARYGYAAARRHALATYGPEAVRAGDQCLAGSRVRTHYRTRYRRYYRKHYGVRSW